MILAACGGDDEEEGDGNDDGGSSVELAETFETTQQGVTLSFDHPSGWVAEEGSLSAVAASSQGALDRGNSSSDAPELEDGDIFINVFPSPTESLGEDATPRALLELFSGDAIGTDALQPGEISDGEIDGKTVARLDLNQGDDVIGEMIAVAISDDWVVVVLAAAADYDDAKATIEAIAATIQIEGTAGAE